MYLRVLQQQTKIKFTATTSSSLPQNISYNSSYYYKLFQHLPFCYCIYLCSSWMRIYIFNFTCLNIEALFILYKPLQLFWSHIYVV